MNLQQKFFPPTEEPMMDQTQRALQKTQELYVDGAKFTPIAMSVLEGHEITEKAGVRVPSHSHDDHESVVYLIKGRMTLTIGDQTFEAKAGDVWCHPIGVSHTSVTLEDSVAIEIKSPPRKTWNLNN
jgi:quercetin dioxygenase-like cupin family protein